MGDRIVRMPTLRRHRAWLRSRRRRGPAEPRAHITQATGRLDPRSGSATFVVVVGPGFDQQVPNAIVQILLGYCRAFETLGIPYLIVDIADVEEPMAAAFAGSPVPPPLPRQPVEPPAHVASIAGDQGSGFRRAGYTRKTIRGRRAHTAYRCRLA